MYSICECTARETLKSDNPLTDRIGIFLISMKNTLGLSLTLNQLMSEEQKIRNLVTHSLVSGPTIEISEHP